MKFTYKNFNFILYADPTENGYFARYQCECGEKHCSNHVDKTKERTLQVAKGNAISHYNRTHEPK